MEINIKLAESLIDAFDSEETGIILWDQNDLSQPGFTLTKRDANR